MINIVVTPLSVNACWQGRRFKTPAYKDYELDVLAQLPKLKIPEGKLKLRLVLGVSSKLADIDNPTKPIIDLLQKAYKFNDNRIYKLEIDKKDVKKGEEFFGFYIEKL